MLPHYLSGPATEDMVAVWQHIASSSPAAADRMIDRFTQAFDRISRFPQSGEGHIHPHASLRRILVPPYIIFYRVNDSDIDIVRVLHSARKWEELI